MTLRLTLFSQEVEDFVVEIKIDADATFADLHQLILQDCGYQELEGQKFLICDEDWRVEKQVCMRDMDARSEEDVYLMEHTSVGELMDDEGQRFAYVFDPDAKRFFLMELTENVFGEPKGKPHVSRRHGKAPLQMLQEEDAPTRQSDSSEAVETGENFYGEDGFEDEELDLDGFEVSN